MRLTLRAAAFVTLSFALACAGTPAPAPLAEASAPRAAADATRSGEDARSPSRGDARSLGDAAVRHATAMVGVPYRFGGRTPRGFDCSGLVVWSYGEAGLGGLPHSAAALERRARPVPLDRLAPGDLLFFDLDGRKAAHVAIYTGGGAFVHAPSPGKHVERVGFDHVYWGERIRRAGRIAH